MQSIEIVSVNISERKGTIKLPVERIHITHTGVANDAHAGAWHRQVSLLGVESFDKTTGKDGRRIEFGEFAENLTTRGMKVYETRPFDRFKARRGNVELEVTQIGKKCHTGCAIVQEVGNCVMPKEGIFCRVINEGDLQAGDVLEYMPKIMKVTVITLSDRASKGEYEDRSGPAIKTFADQHFKNTFRQAEYDLRIIPDEARQLERLITEAVNNGADLIFTTGGTGIGPRDITPDVVKPMLQKEIPGIMEFIRMKSGANLPQALISRGVAGVINKTQIYTLPGSPKAIKEYTDEIFKTYEHCLFMLYGIDAH